MTDRPATPALLVELDTFDANLAAMGARHPGERLRTHVKAFKSTAMARRVAARAEPTQLGVLLADVDHFKAINDQRGHLEGDRVLMAVAATLQRALHSEAERGRAKLYRYGGEEFAVLLSGRDAAQLALLADALRSAVAAGGDGFAPGEVTISIGVAAWWQGAEAPEAALQRADEALYAAKRGGRNRVVVAE